MKRKFLSILLISSVLLSSFIFIGCKEDKNVESNNELNTTENQGTNTKDKSKNDNSSTSKEEEKKKEDVVNNTKKKTAYSEDQKSDTTTKNESKKPLNKAELAKKIIKTETSKDMTVTPVNVTNPGKNFSYRKASESSLYYCNEGKFNQEKLSNGFVIDFFGEAKDGSYQFKITSYDILKNGGDGTVDSGTAYPNGDIVMNH
ncbi:hypothetical protein [Clostridium chrysemydis]|uniref:hypothetical protein n=1 Tax=Clostridium chrysemydis TaxID=2665504 RepID=UPI0018839B06|nr:hypothetical protein [Clostridium chrysemydis]